MQVDVHARVLSAQTGWMTQSLVKMFTSRCIFKDSCLSGHGSGKYPAVSCICTFHSSLLYLQNSDLFEKKWWKSWPWLFVFSCFSFSCTPHPPFFFPYHWSCLCWARRQILPPLCTLLRITFKSGAGFGRSPSALGFCAAVRIRSCDLWFADDMSVELLVAVKALLQINPSNVWYDATGKHPSCYQHWQIAVFLTQNRTSVFSLVQRTDRRLALNSAILQMQNILSVWGMMQVTFFLHWIQ